VSRRGTADERLTAYIKTLVAIKVRQEDPLLVFGPTQLHPTLVPKPRAEIAALERQYVDVFRDILEAGVSEGAFRLTDHRVAARAIANMCEYVFLWFKHQGPTPWRWATSTRNSRWPWLAAPTSIRSWA